MLNWNDKKKSPGIHNTSFLYLEIMCIKTFQNSIQKESKHLFLKFTSIHQIHVRIHFMHIFVHVGSSANEIVNDGHMQMVKFE